ncbi:MAG: hypothetical protein VXW22_11735 [Pseudomonadota bacterium]|nr:hypothetical protein [Pseudomonadota bacterium]
MIIVGLAITALNVLLFSITMVAVHHNRRDIDMLISDAQLNASITAHNRQTIRAVVGGDPCDPGTIPPGPIGKEIW